MALTVAGGALALVGATHLQHASPDAVLAATGPRRAPATTVPPPPHEVRAPQVSGAPRGVRLPSLGISAPVVPVRTIGRTLVPPSDPQLLGWWAGGAKPGARRGSAIIAGHTVHGAGEGALEHLDRLRAGDPVRVLTDRGRVGYRVARVRVITKARIVESAARLFTQSGSPRLVLVTCADWDGTRFLSNVVVVARPLPSQEQHVE